MTAYPVEENGLHWWLATWKGSHHLHAVPAAAITTEQLHAARDECEPLTRKTACGRTLGLTYPGLGSRFGLPRCAHCCRTLGIPAGNGTPCNEYGSNERKAAAT